MVAKTPVLLLLALPMLVSSRAPALADDGPTGHIVAEVTGMS